MSRAKKTEASSMDFQIEWFKWEFLRRNEDYQKDYAAFEARFRHLWRLELHRKR
jgi:hypothetical protein